MTNLRILMQILESPEFFPKFLNKGWKFIYILLLCSSKKMITLVQSYLISVKVKRQGQNIYWNVQIELSLPYPFLPQLVRVKISKYFSKICLANCFLWLFDVLPKIQKNHWSVLIPLIPLHEYSTTCIRVIMCPINFNNDAKNDKICFWEKSKKKTSWQVNNSEMKVSKTGVSTLLWDEDILHGEENVREFLNLHTFIWLKFHSKRPLKSFLGAIFNQNYLHLSNTTSQNFKSLDFPGSWFPMILKLLTSLG